MNSRKISNAREHRKSCTVSEGLLWSVLRARQVCDLKFRREHSIGGFIADFACEAMKLVVEVDGGYHDQTVERDVAREKILRELGWDVLRFSDKDVEEDVEAVARAIATHLRLAYSSAGATLPEGTGIYTSFIHPPPGEGRSRGTRHRGGVCRVNTSPSCRRAPPRKLASSFPALPREGKVGSLTCVDTNARREGKVLVLYITLLISIHINVHR
jgi:very-short-patch-repair endonuclease